MIVCPHTVCGLDKTLQFNHIFEKFIFIFSFLRIFCIYIHFQISFNDQVGKYKFNIINNEFDLVDGSSSLDRTIMAKMGLQSLLIDESHKCCWCDRRAWLKWPNCVWKGPATLLPWMLADGRWWVSWVHLLTMTKSVTTRRKNTV